MAEELPLSPTGMRSQKQPPPCGVMIMFLASPDQLCSGFHHSPGFTSASQAASGVAVTLAVPRVTKRSVPVSTTLPCAVGAASTSALDAAIMAVRIMRPLPSTRF